MEFGRFCVLWCWRLKGVQWGAIEALRDRGAPKPPDGRNWRSHSWLSKGGAPREAPNMPGRMVFGLIHGRDAQENIQEG